jgi:hypothetical protein
MRDVLPGAPAWLARHRQRLDNKYDASKFYLLAVVLPWLDHHCALAVRVRDERADPQGDVGFIADAARQVAAH